MKDKKAENTKKKMINNSPFPENWKDEAFIDPIPKNFDHWTEYFLSWLLEYIEEMDQHFNKSRNAFFKCYELFKCMEEDLKNFTPMSDYFETIEGYDDFWRRVEETKAQLEIKSPFPLVKRKIQPRLAKLIFTGMYLSKLETGKYNKFRDFYNSDKVQFLWFTRDFIGVRGEVEISNVNPSNSPIYLPEIPPRPKKFVDRRQTKITLKKIIFKNCLINTSCLCSQDRAVYLELIRANPSKE